MRNETIHTIRTNRTFRLIPLSLVLLVLSIALAALAHKSAVGGELAPLLFSSPSANPIFLTAPSYATGNLAASVVLGGYNGDGKLDGAIGNGCPPMGSPPDLCATTPGGVSVLLGNGDETLAAAQKHHSAEASSRSSSARTHQSGG